MVGQMITSWKKIKRIVTNRQNSHSSLHSHFLFVQEKEIYFYYLSVLNEAVQMKFYSSVMLGLKWSTKIYRLKFWCQPMAFWKCSTLRRLDLTGSIGACPWRDQWDPPYCICTSQYHDQVHFITSCSPCCFCHPRKKRNKDCNNSKALKL